MSRVRPLSGVSLRCLQVSNDWRDTGVLWKSEEENQLLAYRELMGHDPPDNPENEEQFLYSPRKRTAKAILESTLSPRKRTAQKILEAAITMKT